MLFRVQKGHIIYGGTLHSRGSLFDAELNQVKHLLADNLITIAQSVPDTFSEEPPPQEEVELPTIEEFKKLKADEQKDLLEQLELDVQGNVEQRVAQYAAYYENL